MPEGRTVSLPTLGLLAALAGFAALQVFAAFGAGVFEYPLDDVYIHLAMAENIVGGTYGVNAGESASASSSILFPFLLTPFAGTELQRFLPLFWNILAVGICGWLWGRVLVEAALPRGQAVAFALAGPILLNMSGVGYTGMEAAPHMLASLAIILGLWRFLTGGGVAVWLVLAAIAAPLLRYEGLALMLMAAGVLTVGGAWRAGALIAATSLALVAGFSLFLVSLGLEPLPGSIVAKMSGLDPQGGFAIRLLVGLLANLIRPGGALIGVLVFVCLLGFAIFPALRRGPAGWIVAVAGLAALGHVVLGQIGWMHRYEPYVIVSLVAAFLLASSRLAGRAVGFIRGAAAFAVLAAGVAYMPALWGSYVWNPRAIHLQQAQMARFAQDYVAVPVVVNDLGRVAWGNPDYVLDIWGLGSSEAREIRFGVEKPAPGWAAPLAAEHGAQLAMIYDEWFGTAVGPDWVHVATLEMLKPKGALGDWEVSFYATDPAYEADIRAKLAEFAPTLPPDSVLTFIGGGGV